MSVNSAAMTGAILLYPQVLARSMGITHNLADAEDITQQAYLRFTEHPPRSREPESVLAWLSRIALNAWVDRTRTRA